jgi:hypothetical protein
MSASTSCPTPRSAPPPIGSSARGCVAMISATSAESRGRSARVATEDVLAVLKI